MGKDSNQCQQREDILKTRGVIVLGVQYMMRHGIDYCPSRVKMEN